MWPELYQSDPGNEAVILRWPRRHREIIVLTADLLDAAWYFSFWNLPLVLWANNPETLSPIPFQCIPYLLF
jgi:hypothetical protein